MSTTVKIFVVLNLALAAFLLASASHYLGQQDNYRDKFAEEETAHRATRELNHAEIKDLRDSLRAAQDDRDGKVALVNRLQKSLSAAREKIKRLEFSLAWIMTRWRPRPPPDGQPAHAGMVLSTNAEVNVHVISLGEEDGAKVGFKYIVARGSKYIATIELHDVQARQSAGSALDGLSQGEIHRGDKVTKTP